MWGEEEREGDRERKGRREEENEDEQMHLATKKLCGQI